MEHRTENKEHIEKLSASDKSLWSVALSGVCLSALKPMGLTEYIHSIRLCNGAVQWFLFSFCFPKGRLGSEKRWAGNGRRGDQGQQKRRMRGVEKGSRRDREEIERRSDGLGMRMPGHFKNTPSTIHSPILTHMERGESAKPAKPTKPAL